MSNTKPTAVVTFRHGRVEFIYHDALAPLLKQGDFAITRASHVEPHPTKPGWLADMQPSRGPVLGEGAEATPPHRECDCDQCERVVLALPPFPTRQAALDAEVIWLRKNRGL